MLDVFGAAVGHYGMWRLIHRLTSCFVFAIVLAIPLAAYAQDRVPSSPRSHEAVSRVRPKLERQLAEKGLRFGAPIYIRIFKKERELDLWLERGSRFHFFKAYRICTYGSGSLGPKIRQGDGQAPEGFYYVTPNQLNPLSKFHLSFDLGYPNAYDRSRKRTGSALMVHGSCVSIGCYAMTDDRIEEIYALADAALRNRQSFFRVHAFPFRMIDGNMRKHEDSKWYTFWENLKEGYDYFGRHANIPPNVEAKDQKYVFERL